MEHHPDSPEDSSDHEFFGAFRARQVWLTSTWQAAVRLLAPSTPRDDNGRRHPRRRNPAMATRWHPVNDALRTRAAFALIAE